MAASNSAAARPAVLMLGLVHRAQPELARLDDVADLMYLTTGSRDDFIRRCEAGDYSRVVAILRTLRFRSDHRPLRRRAHLASASFCKVHCAQWCRLRSDRHRRLRGPQAGSALRRPEPARICRLRRAAQDERRPLHPPASRPGNKGHIGAKQLEMMKDGVVIVNTARGSIIDEAALVHGLETGKVRAVGLDVYEKEPEIHPSLIQHPGAVLLHHIGTGTVDTQRNMELLVIDNVRSAITRGGTPYPGSRAAAAACQGLDGRRGSTKCTASHVRRIVDLVDCFATRMCMLSPPIECFGSFL